MKKIFTLALFSGIFATSFAQYGAHQNNGQQSDAQYAYSSGSQFNKVNNGKYYNNDILFSAKERNFRIDKVNQIFHDQLRSIKMNRFMTFYQKKVAIKKAENEKALKITMVNQKYDSQFHNGYGRR